MAGGIVGEHDIARAETLHRTIAGLDFDVSSERYDILAPRRGVTIAQMGCRRATKDDPMRRLERGYFHVSMYVKFNFYFFEMGFVVRPGVNSNDLHEWGGSRM